MSSHCFATSPLSIIPIAPPTKVILQLQSPPSSPVLPSTNDEIDVFLSRFSVTLNPSNTHNPNSRHTAIISPAAIDKVNYTATADFTATPASTAATDITTPFTSRLANSVVNHTNSLLLIRSNPDCHPHFLPRRLSHISSLADSMFLTSGMGFRSRNGDVWRSTVCGGGSLFVSDDRILLWAAVLGIGG